MSLYIGASSTEADYIAGKNELEDLVEDVIRPYITPMIGEIKFVPILGSGNIPNLTKSGDYWIPNLNFDGWTRADGSKYRKVDFPSAWAVYKSNSSTDFRVPTIADFIRGSEIGLDSCEQQNQISRHQHPISYDGTLGSSSIIIDKGLAFASASENSNGAPVKRTVNGIPDVTIPKFHNGRSGTKVGDYCPVPLDITLKTSQYKLFFGDLTTDSHSTNSGIFSPRSQRLAAMIYIGEKGD